VSFLFGPGIGQLYNGKLRKAAAFVIGLPIALALCARLMMALQTQPWNVVLPMCGFATFLILSWVDAGLDARTLRQVPRPWYGRWHTCMAAGLLNVFVIMPAAVVMMRTTWAQAFKLPAGSMEPTLLIGDRLLVDRTAYGIHVGSTVIGARAPARGDLIAFRYPKNPAMTYLKRVIGLPGERIEVRGKTVYVDGCRLDEPYAHYLSNSDGDLDGMSPWGPEKVPAGHVFVLGDSRDRSLDSRFFGWVPIADLLGEAKVVYFSWESTAREYSRDSTKGRVRWERIGLALR